MRSKRLTTLMLGAVMALSTLGLTATTVSADYDEHSNIFVAAVVAFEDIESQGNWQSARTAAQLRRDIRHWVRDHNVPRFVRRAGCTDEFKDFVKASNWRAIAEFRYARGKATNYQEYIGGWARQTVRVQQKWIQKRAASNWEDRAEELIDCLFDPEDMPRRFRGLL